MCKGLEQLAVFNLHPWECGGHSPMDVPLLSVWLAVPIGRTSVTGFPGAPPTGVQRNYFLMWEMNYFLMWEMNAYILTSLLYFKRMWVILLSFISMTFHNNIQ